MKFVGVQIKVERNAVYTFCVLVILFMAATGIIGVLSGDLPDMSLAEALVVAVAAASFHFFAQLIHMIGHALAAWATGYPMSGMVFLYVLAMSLYPSDEPPLTEKIHIQRSLGGVVAFGLLLVIMLVVWSATRDAPQWTVRYLTTYMLINAALLFTVSALVSDGVLFVLRKEWQTGRPS